MCYLPGASRARLRWGEIYEIGLQALCKLVIHAIRACRRKVIHEVTLFSVSQSAEKRISLYNDRRAPIAQRIEHLSSKEAMKVRFPLGAHNYV